MVKQPMRVMITGGGSGGHVSPALAVAQRLRRDNSAVELLYVGGDLTMEGSSGLSLEARLVQPTGIPLAIIHSGKLKRGRLSWSTVSRLWGVVPGLIDAWRVVRVFHPDVLFSSGGYVSLPVVVAAWLQRVPIVIHEQTAAVGLANTIAAKMARAVAITFPQSASYFNPNKVVLTGNPIQPEIIDPDRRNIESLEMGRWLGGSTLPVIYITGGGLGSHIINVAVESGLEQLLQQYRIVHQCGAHAGFKDYERLHQRSIDLPTGLRDRYYVAQHFSAREVGLIYSRAALVVARSGANTVLELAAYGLPAVLIPIPWVTHDEQTKNAQILVEAGTAVILPEKELTAATLNQSIEKQLATFEMASARQRAKALVDREATSKLTTLVLQVGSRKR